MTTDSANSERERPAAYGIRTNTGGWFETIAPVNWTTFDARQSQMQEHPWVLNGKAEVAPLYDEAAITSLRACVSRKDEEIEGLKKRLARVEAITEHPNCQLCRDNVPHGHAQSATGIAAQAEGRQEGKS